MCSSAGVLHGAVVLITELCERSPETLERFRKVTHTHAHTHLYFPGKYSCACLRSPSVFCVFLRPFRIWFTSWRVWWSRVILQSTTCRESVTPSCRSVGLNPAAASLPSTRHDGVPTLWIFALKLLFHFALPLHSGARFEAAEDPRPQQRDSQRRHERPARSGQLPTFKTEDWNLLVTFCGSEMFPWRKFHCLCDLKPTRAFRTKISNLQLWFFTWGYSINSLSICYCHTLFIFFFRLLLD